MHLQTFTMWPAQQSQPDLGWVHPTQPQSLTTEQLPHFFLRRFYSYHAEITQTVAPMEFLQDRSYTFCSLLPVALIPVNMYRTPGRLSCNGATRPASKDPGSSLHWAFYQAMWLWGSLPSMRPQCPQLWNEHFTPRCCCSVAQSCPTLCNTMECQASLSFTMPGLCSNSCPLSQWCHSTIASSTTLFSSCPQSFPVSRSFPMSQLFVSGGRSIGDSASASVLPKSIHDRFPLGLTGFISCCSRDSHLLQHHSSKAPILWHSLFFVVQLSHSYVTTEKYHSFDHVDLCQQSNVSAFKYAI